MYHHVISPLRKALVQTLRPNFQPFSSATYAPPYLCNVCGQAFFAAGNCSAAVRGCMGLQCWILRKVALFSFLKGILWQTRRKDQASKHSIHAMFPCFCNEWSDSLFHLISCFSDLWVSRLASACSVMLHDQARRWQWPSWQWPSYHLALRAQHALSAFRPSQTSLESGSFPTWSCALQRFSEPQDPSGAWYYSSRRVVQEKIIPKPLQRHKGFAQFRQRSLRLPFATLLRLYWKALWLVVGASCSTIAWNLMVKVWYWVEALLYHLCPYFSIASHHCDLGIS